MKKGCLWIVGIFIGLFLIGAIFGGNDKKEDKSSTEAAVDTVDVGSSSSTTSTEPHKVTKTWSETSSTDEMTDSKNIWKEIVSDNTVDFDFPYEGGSTLSIDVRYMKKYGTDVILTLSKGQVNCNGIDEGEHVTVRFDNNKPKRFYVNTPSDGSTNQLFLRSPRSFIKEAKKAKVIKVEIPVYQEGNPTFTFTVDEPLTWNH